jgi:8-oxo-dGTP diphosphatase
MKDLLYKTGDKTTCSVAIIIKDNRILIGLRHYASDNSVWTIPGGRCNFGETLENTLRREVEEETGINDLKILKYLGKTPGAKQGDEVFLFLCDTEQEVQLIEPEKFSEWRWFDLKNCPENFINPTILDFIKE